MADIINLRLARKQKVRGEKEQRAVESRALHGRTKAERELDRARETKLRNDLEGHKRDRDGDE